MNSFGISPRGSHQNPPHFQLVLPGTVQMIRSGSVVVVIAEVVDHWMLKVVSHEALEVVTHGMLVVVRHEALEVVSHGMLVVVRHEALEAVSHAMLEVVSHGAL